MKNFYKTDEGAKKLYDMIYAPIYTKVLFAGIKLDVFSHLKEPATYEKVANELMLHTGNTKCLLNALASIDLLDKENNLYVNRSISNKYLVKGESLYMGQFLVSTSEVSGFDSIDIVKHVEEGPSSGFEDKEGLEGHEIFGDYTEMLKRSQLLGRAFDYAKMVSSLPEFNGFRKMLDIGGGPGILSIAILKKHSELQGVVFETPQVASIAKETIAEYGMQDRINVMDGDFMTDPIGEGYDFIFAAACLNFAKHDMDGIIKKLYDALNAGGVLISISEGLVNENTKPKEHVIGWLPATLKGCDFSLAQGEISDAALRNGFKSVYKRTIDTLMGELDVDIIRK